MITYESGIATVEFPWPTNDTSGGVLNAMAKATLSALAAAGYRTTSKPAFAALVPAEGGGYLFRLTAPATAPDQEGGTP